MKKETRIINEYTIIDKKTIGEEITITHQENDEKVGICFSQDQSDNEYTQSLELFLDRNEIIEFKQALTEVLENMNS